MEVWKDTFCSDKYEVSTLGRIRRKNKEKCLKITYAGTGSYGKVTLGRTVVVHRVVALAFLGDRPKGLVINHIDGNKRNNKVSNLEYVTPSENCRQACNEQGLRKMYGEHHNKTRLKPQDIIDIKSKILQGRKQKEIAEEYGVHPTTISQIKRRKDGYYASY